MNNKKTIGSHDQWEIERLLQDALREARSSIESADLSELDQFVGILPTEDKTARVVRKIRLLIDSQTAITQGHLTAGVNQTEPSFVPRGRSSVICNRRINRRLLGTLVGLAASVLVLSGVAHYVHSTRFADDYARELQVAEGDGDNHRIYGALKGYVNFAPEDQVARLRLYHLHRQLFVGGVQDQNEFADDEITAMNSGPFLACLAEGRTYGLRPFSIPEPSSGVLLFLAGSLLAFSLKVRRATIARQNSSKD